MYLLFKESQRRYMWRSGRLVGCDGHASVDHREEKGRRPNTPKMVEPECDAGMGISAELSTALIGRRLTAGWQHMKG